MTLKTQIKRNPKVAWRVLEGMLVIVTPTDTTIHRLNTTGTFVWDFLGKKKKQGPAILRMFSFAPPAASWM